MKEKKLIIFTIITFGIPYLMGIPMVILYRNGKDLDIFAEAQMFYPAAGVILSCLIYNWKDKKLPKKFFVSFLILTGMIWFSSFSLLFFDRTLADLIEKAVFTIGSLIVATCYFTENAENRIAYHLQGKNWKKSSFLIGLFVVLHTLYILIGFALNDPHGMPFSIDTLPIQVIFLITLPTSYLFAFPAFFGEEYGWRGYLQPILMERFGKRKGVILLGMVWGIWHLPLDLFFYAPQTAFLSVLSHQIGCISLGIFFAYVYLKTENIWSVVLLHFLNNNLIPVFTGSEEISNSILTVKDVAISAILYIIIFLPFLFTKVFSNKSKYHNT